MSRRRVSTWPITLVACLFLVSLWIFVYQPYKVEGNSMLPTYHGGQVIIIDKLAYRKEMPRRGDVVALNHPEYGFNLKRVVGLPGELIYLRAGTVYIDGKEQDEPYASKERAVDCNAVEIPEGNVYIIGDNRAFEFLEDGHTHYESRKGQISYEIIIGKVVFAFR